jgi:hypothetical protein
VASRYGYKGIAGSHAAGKAPAPPKRSMFA